MGFALNCTLRTFACGMIALVSWAGCPVDAADFLPPDQPAARRGYDFLINKVYLPADFDQATFDQIWRSWPPPLQAKAAQATPDERRAMAFRRYGLTARPGDESGKPLQYVVDGEGNWVMNCFTCHGGQLLGKPYPGRPNSDIGLQSLVADVRLTKLIIKKQFSPMDAGSIVYPLGKNRGLTNSVMFGVTLMAYRQPDLELRKSPRKHALVHHDMDAPPWWNFRYRKKLYIDAFATKSARSLMPFLLVPENGPEKFAQWERDYEDVYAFLASIEPPEYPFPIDRALATHGQQLFHDNCAECHGSYGAEPDYPERVIPIDEIGTDPVRLEALKKDSRVAYADSWFTHFRKHETVLDPVGYVAPPLHGIWASAPYFHNGSVPTLWHVCIPTSGLPSGAAKRLPTSLRRKPNTTSRAWGWPSPPSIESRPSRSQDTSGGRSLSPAISAKARRVTTIQRRWTKLKNGRSWNI